MNNKPKNHQSFIYLLGIILIITAPGSFFRLLNDDLLTFIVNTSAAICLFLLPIVLFRNRLKWYAWLLLPVILVSIFNIASIYHYQMPINDGLLTVAINTNQEEFTELASGYWFSFLIITFLYVLTYLFLLNRVPKQLSLKQSATVSATALLIILLLPFFDEASYGYFRKLRARYYSVFPTSVIYAASNVYAQYQIMDETKSERDQFSFKAVQYNNQPQIYVLVIGESDRRDHWSLYGYHRNTTPKMSRKKNLIPFNNIHTTGYLTEFAVPIILTGIDPTNFMQHTKQKSIISLFKEAGFETYWISNQTDYGHISIHAAESNNRYFFSLDENRKTKNANDDSELLPPLKKVLAEPGNKKFIIVKLQGSHYDYAKRYPKQYDVFKPSNKTVPTSANDYINKQIIINTYDNTVLYTDTILDEMINLIDQQNKISTVFYISDHGEDLFDDERRLSQHAAEIPSKYIAPIPFTIWYSNHYKQLGENQIQQLNLNKEKKASSQHLLFTIAELAGIKFPLFDSTKSLSSKAFIENPRYIIGGNLKTFNSDSLQ
ncbi:sulfatase-like hydrolase/transferase [Sediminibacterium sp.]|uniref:sulfatase-like hydrolase/transferase n=1 Tax=Sediminibacterium sp. TaxID=1917865 RepID=UPI0025F8F844|nr:sulfatase-like hydrolase/transferase [Sediminibacterium sp.]